MNVVTGAFGFIGRYIARNLLDAIGPEAFTFEEFVRVLAARVKPGVKLTGWVEEHQDKVGISYSSELGRHFRWP
jgi:nucleoside-diphosphate-sugar epimerase